MNCKPGDLAVIVNDPYWDGVDVGKLVQVLRLAPDDGVGPEWECLSLSGPLKHGTGYNTGDQIGIDIEDRLLRPIRDPGDDATDETLTWLPSPVRERVSQ